MSRENDSHGVAPELGPGAALRGEMQRGNAGAMLQRRSRAYWSLYGRSRWGRSGRSCSCLSGFVVRSEAAGPMRRSRAPQHANRLLYLSQSAYSPRQNAQARCDFSAPRAKASKPEHIPANGQIMVATSPVDAPAVWQEPPSSDVPGSEFLPCSSRLSDPLIARSALRLSASFSK